MQNRERIQITRPKTLLFSMLIMASLIAVFASITSNSEAENATISKSRTSSEATVNAVATKLRSLNPIDPPLSLQKRLIPDRKGSEAPFSPLSSKNGDCERLEYAGPYAYYWLEPDANGIRNAAMRFTPQSGKICTLITAYVAVYGPGMIGSPDMQVSVYYDNGGLPGELYGSITVPHESLPLEDMAYVPVDFSVLDPPFIVGPGAEFHLGVSPVGGEADSLPLLLDDGTYGDLRSTVLYNENWYTFASLFGTDYNLLIDAYVCYSPVPPLVRIERTHNSLQGHYEYVSITTENSELEMGGFDFLVSYDSAALALIEVIPGQLLEDCGWEYFSYHTEDPPEGVPSGLVRIVASADLPDPPTSPSCYGPPDTDPHELAKMTFQVTDDPAYAGQFVPIYFFWGDCGDNSISSIDGENVMLYIDRRIYDFEDNLIWDEDDDDQFPENARIPWVGVPDWCLYEYWPPEDQVDRLIDFTGGGVGIEEAEPLPGVTIDQVDRMLDDSLVENSDWGRIGVDIGVFTSAIGMTAGYLNGYTDTGWVIQNLIIDDTLDIEEIAMYFSLGVPAGTDVTSLSIYFTFTEDPLEQHTDGPRTVYTVGSVNFFVSGALAESGDSTPNPPGRQINREKGESDRVLLQTTWDVNIESARGQCVPCATTNCLQYLENRYGPSYGINIPHDHLMGLRPDSTLVGQHGLLMKRRKVEDRRDGGGVGTTDWVDGKLQYLSDNWLSSKLMHHFQVINWSMPTEEDYTHAGITVENVTDAQLNIDFDWICDCVDRGEAVELAVSWGYDGGGHAVRVIDCGRSLASHILGFLLLLHDGDQMNDNQGTEVLQCNVRRPRDSFGNYSDYLELYWGDWVPIRFVLSSHLCYATGDMDNDGYPLDQADYNLLSLILAGQATPSTPLYIGDLDGNCILDQQDLDIFQEYFVSGFSAFNRVGGYPVKTCCSYTGLSRFAWRLADTGWPTARWGHSMVYDAANYTVIMFGNETDFETYGWDGANWSALGPPSFPPPRIRQAMAYDSKRALVYLFGGEDGASFYNDLWSYSSATNIWTQVAAGGSIPSNRASAAMVYDPTNDALVLYGGRDQSSDFSETYEYNLQTNTWNMVSAGGAGDPNAQYSPDMVYDPTLSATVLYGGGFPNGDETWEYSNGSWTQLFPTSNPGTRYGHKMVFNSASGRVQLYGGNILGVNLGLWELDRISLTWIEVAPSTPGPGSRNRHGMAYDQLRRETVLFGGVTSKGANDETWCYPGESVTRAFKIIGSSNGVGWSWCVNGPLFSVCDLIVPPVPSGGTADALTQQFVNSINSAGSPGLVAAAYGNVFTVTASGTQQFALGVGPSGQQPNCYLPPQTSCGFNPDMSEITLAGDDCNGNGVDDAIDIANETSQDSNEDGIPDECAVSYVCGDANGDETVNLLDITFLISYLYKGGAAPDPLEAGDANGNGAINLLDITYLIAYLYQDGPDPVCP